jgi:type IV secretion system protein VirD4
MHPVGYMNIAAFLQKPDKERSGCVSTANSRLDLWANPIIDKTTSRSDFDITAFKTILTTVYVGLTPDNIARLKPLMSMFYQQATSFLSKHMPKPEEKYGVLFLMDEFPTLGKMEQFLSGIAYFRGYHVKLFLVVQDTQQLKAAYEDTGMNSFLSNSTYRVTYAANNIETAKLISELIGNKTVASESMNAPKYFDMNPGSRSINVSKAQRALLLPQEVISMDKKWQIILIEASSPIKCQKIFYYKDKFFTSRLMKPIVLPVQDFTGKTNKDVLNDAVPKVKMLGHHPDANPPEKPKETNKDDATSNAA